MQEDLQFNLEFLGKKENLIKILSVFFVILSLFFIFKTIGTYQDNRYRNVSYLYFRGQGEVLVKADVASVSFSVIEEGETPAKAQALASKKINDLMKFLRSKDIKDKDIKTTAYNMSPRYEWVNQPCYSSGECFDPKTKRILVGYEASQSVSVKIRDIEKSGDILTGIGEVGVDNISGLEFSVDDKDALKEDAKKLAIEDAKSKAEKTAKLLGVKLIKMSNFTDLSVQPGPYYDMSYGMGMGGAEKAVMATPEIPSGENKIVSEVEITYEVR